MINQTNDYSKLVVKGWQGLLALLLLLGLSACHFAPGPLRQNTGLNLSTTITPPPDPVTPPTPVTPTPAFNSDTAVITPPNEVVDPPPPYERLPEYTEQSGLAVIGAADAFYRGYFGQGTTVAILGDGVRTTHVDLTMNLLPGVRFGNTAADGEAPVYAPVETAITDTEGTGTQAAGIIGASLDESDGIVGVAPQTRLLAIQTDAESRYAGLRYAITNTVSPVHIIHNAWSLTTAFINDGSGRSTNADGTVVITEIQDDFPLLRAFIDNGYYSDGVTAQFAQIADDLAGRDVVVVVPTGYRGWDEVNRDSDGFGINFQGRNGAVTFSDKLRVGNFLDQYSDSVLGTLSTLAISKNEASGWALAPHYEESLQDRWVNVMAVSGDGETTPYTPYRVGQGSRAAGNEAIKANQVGTGACGDTSIWCIAAPGTDISTTQNTGDTAYVAESGTNIAAAHVAGALAVLKSRFPTMPMSVMVDIMFHTADDIGEFGIDPVYGHGLLNLGRAITVQGAVEIVLGDVALAESPVPLADVTPVSEGGFNSRRVEYASQTGLAAIGAAEAYSRGYFGAGITVAIVGGGVRTTHTDLAPNIIPGVRFTSTDVSDETPETTGITDTDGAGTQAAGVIGARLDNVGIMGVAPLAKLLPIQTAAGSGLYTGDGRYNGLRYAVTAVAPHIIHNNWGVSTEVTGEFDGGPLSQPSSIVDGVPIFRTFIDNGLGVGPALITQFTQIAADVANNNRDVAFVFAAGDNGWNEDTTATQIRVGTGNPASVGSRTLADVIENYTDSTYREFSALTIGANESGGWSLAPHYESSLADHWVNVVALNAAGDGIATSSNACGDTAAWCIAAPGVNIATTDNTHDSAEEQVSGTNIAAAHVAGALAVLRNRFRDTMPMSVIIDIMFETADASVLNNQALFGHGALNLGRAITVQRSALIYTVVDPVTNRLNSPAPAPESVNYEIELEYTRQSGLAAVGALEAFTRGYLGAGATVAIVGSGVLTTHIDLTANLLAGVRFTPPAPPAGAADIISPAIGSETAPVFEDITDTDGTGTQAAGIIGAALNDEGIIGVAPSARLLPIQTEAESRYAGLRYAVTVTATPAPIIYNAWYDEVRLTGTVSDTTRVIFDDPFPLLSSFIDNSEAGTTIRARFAEIATDVASNDRDVAFVFPAGDHRFNSADGIPNFDGSGSYTDSLTDIVENYVDDVYGAFSALTIGADESGGWSLAPYYQPSLEDHWVNVVALNAAGNNIADSSNACGDTAAWCIAAPGTDISTTFNTDGTPHGTHGTESGTHIAAAHVAGALAVLRGRFGAAVPMSAIIDIMFETADDSVLDDTALYGHGVLNLGKAITVRGHLALILDFPIQAPARAQLQVADYEDLPEYTSQPGLAAIGAAEAFGRGYFGAGVTIALIDSGVVTTHPDLIANLEAGVRFSDTEPSEAPAFHNITDPDGSGSQAARIIGAALNDDGIVGVAPLARILPIQAAGEVADEDGIAYLGQYNAFRYAVTNTVTPVHIVQNNLLETTRLVDGDGAVLAGGEKFPLVRAFLDENVGKAAELRAKFSQIAPDLGDVVIVLPAGDDGWNGGADDTLRDIAGYSTHIDAAYGDLDAIINLTVRDGSGGWALAPFYDTAFLDRLVNVVGADTTDSSNITLAANSNACGDSLYWCIAAPGIGIITDLDATPSIPAASHVAGALAVLKSRFPVMPMSVVLDILFATATDIGVDDIDRQFGHGLLNLSSAITHQGEVEIVLAPVETATLSLGNSDPILSVFDDSTAEFTRQARLADIGAAEAFSRGYYGQNTTVAIVGGGVRTTHEDLVANLLPGVRFTNTAADGEEPVYEPVSTDITDTDRRGTYAAGIIGAAINDKGIIGVAPQTKLVPIQTSAESRYNGLRYAVTTTVNAGQIIHNTWNLEGVLLSGTYNGEATVFTGGQPLVSGDNIFFNGGGPLFRAFIDRDFPVAAGLTSRFAEIANDVISNDKDVAFVFRAGSNRWNSVSERAVFTGEAFGVTRGLSAESSDGYVDSVYGAFADLTISVNEASGWALAPHYQPNLEDYWVNVVALTTGNVFYAFGNGCGDTMQWCIAARGDGVTSTFNTDDTTYNNFGGGAGVPKAAAAQVAGALAVLRSRFPTMPMTVMIDIMFATADDLGVDTNGNPDGIDPLYGHGALNLGKAITAQGAVEIVLTPPVITLTDAPLNDATPANFDSSSAEYTNQAGLAAIGAADAFSRNYFGDGVTVAIVGSGVRTTHEDLTANLLAGVRFNTTTTTETPVATGITDTDVSDSRVAGRGTRVAGIIGAASGNDDSIIGVAPQAKIVPIQTTAGDDDDRYNGFRYAVTSTLSTHVIYNAWSLSTPFESSNRFFLPYKVITGNAGSTRGRFPIFQDFITDRIGVGPTLRDRFIEIADDLADNGKDVAIVIPAGDSAWYEGWDNEFTRSDGEVRNPDRRRQIILPSGICCGAENEGEFSSNVADSVYGQLSDRTINANESSAWSYAPIFETRLQDVWVNVVAHNTAKDNLATHSNACGTTADWCIAAPGVNISTTQNSADDAYGTSNEREPSIIAAAHVAGALAVLKSRFGDTVPMSIIIDIMFATADDSVLSDTGRYGHGALNLGSAIIAQRKVNLVITPAVTDTLNLPAPANVIADYATLPEYTSQTGLAAIGAAEAFNRGYFGAGATVALVGSGVLTTHVDLTANLLAGARFSTTDSSEVAETTDIADTDGTGTHAAGIIAAAFDNTADGIIGVAPSAKLLPLQVGGLAAGTHESGEYNAFRYALTNTVTDSQIIQKNHRWLAEDGDYEGPVIRTFLDTLDRADTTAVENSRAATLRRQFLEVANYLTDDARDDDNKADVVIVVAGGDNGWSGGSDDFRISTFNHDVYGVLGTISSPNNRLDGSGGWALAPFYESALSLRLVNVVAADTTGSSAALAANANACGDALNWCIAAPAVGKRSTDIDTDTDYATVGEDFSIIAASHVSGALAVLRSRWGASVPMSVMLDILFDTATDIGTAGIDRTFGHGLLNLGRAVRVRHNLYTAENPALSTLNLPASQAEITPYAERREYTTQGGLAAIGAVSAFNRDYFGQSVTVAIVGSGIRTSHVDLTANVVAGVRFTSTIARAEAPRRGGVTDTDGRGTQAAGVIGAALDNVGIVGVAPSVRLLPIQTHENARYNGLRYAVTNTITPVQVVYNSWSDTVPLLGTYQIGAEKISVTLGTNGAPIFRTSIANDRGAGVLLKEQFTELAADLAREGDNEEAVFVFPAGDNAWNEDAKPLEVRVDFLDSMVTIGGVTNSVFTINAPPAFQNYENPDYGDFRQLAGGISANEASGWALAPHFESSLLDRWVNVVATDASGLAIAPLSNACGATTKLWCIAAPGVNIVSTDRAYDVAYTNGESSSPTGQAAAHVAGALALLKSRFGEALPMSAVIDIMFATALDIGDRGNDDVFGHGLLSIERAINAQGELSIILDPSPQPEVVVAPSLNAATITVTTSSAEYTGSGGLAIMSVSAAFSRGYFGAGVTVAIVGAGMLSHSEFSSRVLEGVSFASTAANEAPVTESINTDSSISTRRFGTHAAGLIAARFGGGNLLGVAPSVRLFPIQTKGGIDNSYNSFRYAITNTATNSQIILNAWATGTDATVVLLGTGSSTNPALRRDARLINFVTNDNSGTRVTVLEVPFRTIGGRRVPVFRAAIDATNSAGNPEFPAAAALTVQFKQIADDLAASERDVAIVVKAGDERWNQNATLRLFYLGSPLVTTTDGDVVTLVSSGSSRVSVSTFAASYANSVFPEGISANEASGWALAPHYQPSLLDYWVNVVAVPRETNPTSITSVYNQPPDGTNRGHGSNACGDTMQWCIAAPIANRYINAASGFSDSMHNFHNFSGQAAAHVSGALALLKSRYGPLVPMSVVIDIMFATATDLGADGVDPVFGHGLVNIEEAITAQDKVSVILNPPSIQPEIFFASPLNPATTTFETAGEYTNSRGLAVHNADAAFTRNYFGEGVTVALVGRGVAPHAEFEGRLVPGYEFFSERFKEPTSMTPMSITTEVGGRGTGGTQAAGIIAANRDESGVMGVAPSAKLLPLRLISAGGADTYYNALRFAITATDVPIVHMNWEGNVRTHGETRTGNELVDFSLVDSSGNPVSVTITTTQFQGNRFINGVQVPQFTTTTMTIAVVIPSVEDVTIQGAFPRFNAYVTATASDGSPLHADAALTINDDDDANFKALADDLEGKDKVIVFAAGRRQWNPNGRIRVNLTGRTVNIAGGHTYTVGAEVSRVPIPVFITTFHDSVLGLLSDAGVTDSESGSWPSAPLHEPRLRGSWVNVVGVDTSNAASITLFHHEHTGSNGCGDTMQWCIAALGGGAVSVIRTTTEIGTDLTQPDIQAAAHVSGALALLRNRYGPHVPMSVVLDIMLETAIDIGADGTDRIFGRGLLNVEAALTLEGSFNLATRLITLAPFPSAVNPSTLLVHALVPTLNAVTAFTSAEYPDQRGLIAINASAAFERGYFGQGTTVAIISRHGAPVHNDLTDNLLPGVCLTVPASPEETACGDSPASSNSNTSAAGVIGAALNDIGVLGVAPSSSLLPIEIFDTNSIDRGIRYAITNTISPAQVIYNVHSREVSFIDDESGRLALGSETRDVTEVNRLTPLFRAFIDRGFYSEGLTAEFAQIADDLEGRDAVVVVPAGDNGWNDQSETASDRITDFSYKYTDSTLNELSDQVEYTEFLTAYSDSVVGSLSTIRTEIRDNEASGWALAPHYQSSLLGSWVNVIATDENNKITRDSNGCGDTMAWCIAAPGDNIVVADPFDNDGVRTGGGTYIAAAHVAGALAVLKSRFGEALPMSVILTIMFETATDLGKPEVYGHGLLNIEAAITVQGLINLATGEEVAASSAATATGAGSGSGALLKSSFSKLSPAMFGLREKLAGVSIAVRYLGTRHYNTSLDKLLTTAVAQEELPVLGNAAEQMLDTPPPSQLMDNLYVNQSVKSGQLLGLNYNSEHLRFNYTICEDNDDCAKPVWSHFGASAAMDDIAPYYATDKQQAMVSVPVELPSALGDSIEVFAGGGLGENAKEFTYSQLGLRYHALPGWYAEYSRISESDTVLGSEFEGGLGLEGAESHQFRIAGRYDIGNNWQLFGLYALGIGEAEGGNNSLFKSFDYRYKAWRVGLTKHALFRSDDELRLGYRHYGALDSASASISRGVLNNGVLSRQTDTLSWSESGIQTFLLGYAIRRSDNVSVGLGFEHARGDRLGSDNAFSLIWKKRF